MSKLIKVKLRKKKLIEAEEVNLTFSVEPFKNGYKVVVEKNGENAGDVEILPLEEKNNAVYVDYIYLRSRFQKQKIGTRLYEEAVKEAKKRGKKYFCSGVIRSEIAESFWQKQLDKQRATKEKIDDKTFRYCIDLSTFNDISLAEENK